MSEFEKYRVRQDRLYQSDFDRILLEEENAQALSDNQTVAMAIDLQQDGERE